MSADDFAKRIMQYAEDHYNDGWDTLVECTSLRELQAEIQEDVDNGLAYDDVLKNVADGQGVSMDESPYKIRTYGTEPAETTNCREVAT